MGLASFCGTNSPALLSLETQDILSQITKAETPIEKDVEKPEKRNKFMQVYNVGRLRNKNLQSVLNDFSYTQHNMVFSGNNQ